jgi:hypothetical protein
MKKKIVKFIIILIPIIGLLVAGGAYVYSKVVDEMFISVLSGMDVTIEDSTLQALGNGLDSLASDGAGASSSSITGGTKTAKGVATNESGQTSGVLGQAVKKGAINSAGKIRHTKLTKDEAKKLIHGISSYDKATAEGIIKSKLSFNDISLIKDLIAGGNVQEAKSLLKSRITNSEKETLKKIFLKYQGILRK